MFGDDDNPPGPYAKRIEANIVELQAALAAATARAENAEAEATLRIEMETYAARDRDRFRAALRQYGQHDGGCRCGYRDPDPDDCAVTRGGACSCGLDAALGEGGP